MNENYWVKTYGGTMMYIAPDAHAWGIGGHNIAMKLYHSSHIGINFATSAYTWGIYANSNGNMYIGRRTGNVDDGSGTYYHTLTASYISSPGFYHSAIGSNSYVLLAGGSYKGLGDFAKGNAGSATKGVYVTGGTVTAMTYSLYANVNSGTAGKLAYYSGSNALSSYTSTIGSATTPIYLSGGVPTACNGVAVKQYANYDIICGESSASFIKNAGNFSPISRVSKVATGEVYIYIDPVYNWKDWFLFAIGGDYTTSVDSIGSVSGIFVQLVYFSKSSAYRNYIQAGIFRGTNKTNGRFHFYILVF
jgi:hypothetical protein